MANFIYRRGHVFWWRRVLRVSDSRTLDARLSLRTFDRLEARNRGAVLTAATGGVLRMLERRVMEAGERLTESELKAIAKRAYDEVLADLCTQQRSKPAARDDNTSASIALIDYFQRLADQGRHALVSEPEMEVYREAQWNEARIRNLAKIAQLREDGIIDHFSAEMLDRQLRLIGHEPTPDKRRRVELALYEPFRDAHIAALEMSWESERRRSALWEPAAVVASIPPAAAQPAPVEGNVRQRA